MDILVFGSEGFGEVLNKFCLVRHQNTPHSEGCRNGLLEPQLAIGGHPVGYANGASNNVLQGIPRPKQVGVGVFSDGISVGLGLPVHLLVG